MMPQCNVKELAQWFVSQPENVQADFFNEFDKQLRDSCKAVNHSMKCYLIGKGLSEEALRTLRYIGEDHGK